MQSYYWTTFAVADSMKFYENLGYTCTSNVSAWRTNIAPGGITFANPTGKRQLRQAEASGLYCYDEGDTQCE
jgi:hypothetical protein